MFGFVIEYNKSVVGFTICEDFERFNHLKLRSNPNFYKRTRAQSFVANWKYDESVFFEAIKN